MIVSCVLHGGTLNLSATIHPNWIYCKIGLLGSNECLLIHWRYQNSLAPIILSILSDLLKWESASFSPDGISFSFNLNDVFDMFPVIFGNVKHEMMGRKPLYLDVISKHVLYCISDVKLPILTCVQFGKIN